MLNNVSIAGRLVRDMETRQTQGGTTVGNFTLAVDRPKYKDRDKETDFIRCILWGKQAEGLAPHLTKGKPIAVTGSIQTRKWEDKDGNKRESVEVKVDRVSFLPDGKGKSTGGNNSPTEDNLGGFGAEINFDKEDCPF